MKKWFQNRYKNPCDCSSIFLLILAPFWTPRATLKFMIFPSFLALGVDLEPSWRQEGPQSVPRQPPDLDFQGFGTILERILEQISITSRLHSNTKFTSFGTEAACRAQRAG